MAEESLGCGGYPRLHEPDHSSVSLLQAQSMPLSSPAMAANAVKPSGLAPVGAVRPAAAPVSQPTSRPPSRAGNDTVHCIEVSVGGTIFRASASTLKKSPFFGFLVE
mmetsp:Transcript_106854/g.344758  ORF Transcript_106854/g.344758 Transcript_106854/m.344758 type:complete len:107 (-) Transcript_106854:680-1000(-)